MTTNEVRASATPHSLIRAVYSTKLEEERCRGRLTWPSAQYASDVVGFAYDILGFAMTAKQAECADRFVSQGPRARFSWYTGRRLGKSRLAATLGLHAYCTYSDATVILLAPTARQIAEIVWHDVVSLFHASGRCLSCRLRNPDGPRPCPHSAVIDGVASASVRTGIRSGDRRLFGMSPRNADHVRGIAGQHQTYILDEGSGIPDDVQTQCDGNTSGGGRLIAFGQPSNPIGWFCKTFADPQWHSLHASSLDSPNVVLDRVVVPNLADRHWTDRMRERWGEHHPVYQTEVLGLPASADSRRLLTEVEYAAAVERHATLPDGAEPLAFGIDPASGAADGDQSTIAYRRGWKLFPVLSFRGGLDLIISELASLIKKHRAYPQEIVWVRFDCEGPYGRGLREALNIMKQRDDFLRTEGLESGVAGPGDVALLKRCGCFRRRDAYAWAAMQRFKTVAGLVHDEQLREEILFSYFEPDISRGARLPDKRKYRTAIGRSPDKFDAVIYAMWDGDLPAMTELAAAHRQDPQRSALDDFDPFALPGETPSHIHDPYETIAPGSVGDPFSGRWG